LLQQLLPMLPTLCCNVAVVISPPNIVLLTVVQSGHHQT